MLSAFVFGNHRSRAAKGPGCTGRPWSAIICIRSRRLNAAQTGLVVGRQRYVYVGACVFLCVCVCACGCGCARAVFYGAKEGGKGGEVLPTPMSARTRAHRYVKRIACAPTQSLHLFCAVLHSFFAMRCSTQTGSNVLSPTQSKSKNTKSRSIAMFANACAFYWQQHAAEPRYVPVVAWTPRINFERLPQ